VVWVEELLLESTEEVLLKPSEGLTSSRGCGDVRIVQHSSFACNQTENNQLEEKYLEPHETNGMLGGDQDSSFKGARWSRYFQSKLANSVFHQALHARLTQSKDEDCKNVLSSLCGHPGISSTGLGHHLAEDQNVFLKPILGALQRLVSQSPTDGAMGLIRGMMSPRDEVEGGTLYGPRGFAGYAVAMPSGPHETDPNSMDMLWKKSADGSLNTPHHTTPHHTTHHTTL
jgi:hypothetical protein